MKKNPDELAECIDYFVLNKGKMLPNWKKPHSNLMLISLGFTLFVFFGKSRSKEGLNSVV